MDMLRGLLFKMLTKFRLEVTKPRRSFVTFCATYWWLSQIIISSIADLLEADQP